MEARSESQRCEQRSSHGLLWARKGPLGAPLTPQQTDKDPIGKSDAVEKTFGPEFGG